jgi:hypothetical protein
MGWHVEDASGNEIAELRHKEFVTSQLTAVDGKFLSSGALVEMRPRDAIGIINYVNIGNVTIAEISVHLNNVRKPFVGYLGLSGSSG